MDNVSLQQRNPPSAIQTLVILHCEDRATFGTLTQSNGNTRIEYYAVPVNSTLLLVEPWFLESASEPATLEPSPRRCSRSRQSCPRSLFSTVQIDIPSRPKGLCASVCPWNAEDLTELATSGVAKGSALKDVSGDRASMFETLSRRED